MERETKASGGMRQKIEAASNGPAPLYIQVMGNNGQNKAAPATAQRSEQRPVSPPPPPKK